MFLVRAPLKAMRDVDIPLRENGFLDLPRVGPTLEDAAMLWIGDFVELFEDGRPLGKPTVTAARVSLPSDKSFADYDEALASLTGPPLPADTELYWQDGLLDVRFEYPIRSDRSRFAMRPGLTRLGLQVNVVLRLLMPGTPERVFDVHGDAGLVELDPRWYQAALRFTRDGFFHILDGIDHLLFLFCLVIPFRRLRPLVAVVTAFTVAHSITLIASAFDMAPDGAVVPAAHRDVDCRLDRLHGHREHHRRASPTPLDRDLRLRPRARLRLLVRPARVAAVRRQPPADVAAGLQRRRGAGAVAGAAGAAARAGAGCSGGS